MFKVIRDILGIPELRRRVFFTLTLLMVYRIGFHIYLPGVDIGALTALQTASQQSGGGLLQFISMTSVLTGGDLRNATIFSLGIMPYISASIIFSLLVKVFPRLDAIQKEGEAGRRTINRWTRYSTVVLCILQSVLIVQWLSQPQGPGNDPLSSGGFSIALLQMMVLTAGTLFLMWLGEKITEGGIGNGISLLIMAGIISRVPSSINELAQQFNSLDSDGKPFFVLKILMLIFVFFAIVASVVYITKGQRRIPIQYARTVKGRRVYGGQRHYMPIKVNSAGVLPIIFAQSLLLLPTGIFSVLVSETTWFVTLLQPGAFWYLTLYVLMIGFFTYFWTSLMFNPVEIANNMKDHGSFIPGIRPGRRTADYLQQVLGRITLAGAVFLASIALVPQVVAGTMGVSLLLSGFLGGTGILIVVGVALDLVDKIEAQLLVRQYEGFVRSPAEKKVKGGA
ncbi:MAG TPA: preprotein translocase subunit SecY [Planctomycetes bacterium]|nr:preprotein translocase subunit SecY [Planctomycetota bacterium]HIN80071.1 preprotein translocase subunit SecY [Planctomycetota bacterium]